MVVSDVVGHFRHRSSLRAYRRTLSSELSRHPALCALPALATLSLPIVDPGGAPTTLNEALRETPFVALFGAAGSGRWLALHQLALRWVSREDAGEPIPALLELPFLDDGRSPPATLIADWLRAAMPVAEQKPPARGFLPRLRLRAPSADLSGQIEWLLLIEGWEELAPERQAVWRTALCDQLWDPSPHLVVALPPDAEPWPGFAPLAIEPPTSALLTEWIEALASPPAPLLAALVGGPLEPLGERLFEVLLLAWLVPRFGLPGTRADLYARALAEVTGCPFERLDHDLLIAELQMLAAYGERPPMLPSGLARPGADGTLHFTHPLARRYLAARQVVAEGRYDLLGPLAASERADLAILIATMLPDPSPLYAALWRDGHPSGEDVLLLGRCLRERRPRDNVWVLRTLGALALLMRDGAPAQRVRARDLLRACLPMQESDLAPRIDDAHGRFLLWLFGMLPSDLALPALERFVFGESLAGPFAWELADLLRERLVHDTRPHPAPSEPGALARWCYVQSLRGSEARKAVERVAGALPALAANADATRLARAASALFCDPALEESTRLAAFTLLREGEQPVLLDALEQAFQDESAAVRQAAFETIVRLEQAHTLLGRVASAESTPWDIRLAAIQLLGAQVMSGEPLERCAANPHVPYYARFLAIALLGRHTHGLSHLLTLVADEGCDPVGRAAATRQLAAAGDQLAAETLRQLLDSPAVPTTLATALCDALGELGDSAAAPSLIRALERAASDVALALAAIRALGRVGGDEAVEPLALLLGPEAIERLRRGLQPDLLQQPAIVCLQIPSLPEPIALRLSAALADDCSGARESLTLLDFLCDEAGRVRIAAAQALGRIGGKQARDALLEALRAGTAGEAASAVAAALVEIEGEASAETLGQLLAADTIDMLTRWVVIQQLAGAPSGEGLLIQALKRADGEAFIRGALLEALAARVATRAIPLVSQIASDRDSNIDLRAQAVLALGRFGEQAEAALIRLIGDSFQDAILRGLAAEQLPDRLSDEGRRSLHSLLEQPSLPAPIASGALRTLGRVGDHEALPLLLRYCHDDRASVAQSAIAALADLGDATVAPALTRILQNARSEGSTRLEAAGALLRLGGAQHQGLLRLCLDRGPLPLQLQALEHLINAQTSPEDLMTLLVDRSRPLPLRLRLLERCAATIAPALAGLLEADDRLELRCLAAEALGRLRWAGATPALLALVERAGTPASLRKRCIAALGAIGGIASEQALSRLAADPAQEPAARVWAVEALWEAVHEA